MPTRTGRSESEWAPTEPWNEVQYSRATAYSPSSLMMPANSTPTGVGTTE